MLSGHTSIVWLVDDHEIRRMAYASFLSPWAERAGIEIRQLGLADLCHSDGAGDAADGLQLFIVATGGASLRDPEIAETVTALVDNLGGQPLVIMSDVDGDAEVGRAIECGVHGHLSTRMQPSVAVAALEFILSGGTYFNRKSLVGICKGGTVIAWPGAHDEKPNSPRSYRLSSDRRDHGAERGLTLITSPAHRDQASEMAPDSRPALTGRQTEVVSMLMKGRSNKEIARLLCLSEATVKIFVRQVMKKFGAMNRTQVALLASQAVSQQELKAQAIRLS